MTYKPSPTEIMFDADCRIESLIWVPGIGGEDGLSEAFSEGFCEWLPEREDAPLYASLPRLAKFADVEIEADPDEIAGLLLGISGFLIQAATPVRKYHDAKTYTSGWGYYATSWLYAATADEIADACARWAESKHQLDLEAAPK